MIHDTKATEADFLKRREKGKGKGEKGIGKRGREKGIGKRGERKLE